MKKGFVAGLGFPVSACLVLALATVAAYALLSPDGGDIYNEQIINVFSLGGWGVGPVMGLLSFICIGILNVMRRLFKMRNVHALHCPVVIAGILPWLIFGWVLTGEPRHTPIARAIIDLAGRPMLLGAIAATGFAVLVGLFTLLPKKK